MSGRHGRYIERLGAALFGTRGAVPEALRRAAADRGAGRDAAVPPELARFVDDIARHAYRVTDEDVRALRDRGISEDAIFEIVVSVAFGAASVRLERGLAALRGEAR